MSKDEKKKVNQDEEEVKAKIDLDEESYAKLAALLSNTDLSDVSASSTGRPSVKDGYYLSKVVSAELKVSKNSGKVQVKLSLQAIEDGLAVDDDKSDEVPEYEPIKNTKGAYFDKYYPLTTEQELKRYVSDMLKFEDEPGHSILPKEAFVDPELMAEALGILEGMQIYVQVDVVKDKDDDTKSNTWYSLVSWERATKLDLPLD